MAAAAEPAEVARQALYAQLAVQGEDEYVRLRLQHELLARAMGGQLIRAPLPAAPRILDSATGDGKWMMEVLREHPDATLHGTDLEAKHFEHLKDLPAAISFEQQSILEPWPTTYHGSFDLVHQRYCLSVAQPTAAAQAVANLLACAKPGAYVQLVEPSLTNFDVDEEAHGGFRQLVEFIRKAFEGANLNPNPAAGLKGWLQAAGADDIHEQVITYGLGAAETDPEWAVKSEVSIIAMIRMYAAIASQIPNYFYSKEDFANLEAKVTEELQTVGNHWRVTVVWGHRPS